MAYQTTIGGRAVTVSHWNDSLRPVTPEHATLVKMVFEDGEMRFVSPLEKVTKYDDDEPRNESGEWTAGGGAGEGGRYNPGIHASGGKAVDAKKKEWREIAPSTVEALLAQSVGNQKILAKVAKVAAADVGTTFADPGPKSEKRIREKVEIDGKLPNQIADAARGGFIVQSPEHGDKIVADLAKHFEVADEGWQKNDAGYFDRKVIVRFKNGQMGELQMWPPGMLETKESGGGHKLYEQWRVLPKDSPKAKELNDEMKTLYSGVEANLPPSWEGLFGKSG